MRNICAVAYSLGVEKACLAPKRYIHQHGAESEKQRANAPLIAYTCCVNIVASAVLLRYRRGVARVMITNSLVCKTLYFPFPEPIAPLFAADGNVTLAIATGRWGRPRMAGVVEATGNVGILAGHHDRGHLVAVVDVVGFAVHD